MKDIGITVEDIALIYLILPFANLISNPLTGKDPIANLGMRPTDRSHLHLPFVPPILKLFMTNHTFILCDPRRLHGRQGG